MLQMAGHAHPGSTRAAFSLPTSPLLAVFNHAVAADADESCLKYAPEELLEWVRLALGCEQAAHESVAALAHIAEFGAE
jgi:hypothetical protein